MNVLRIVSFFLGVAAVCIFSFPLSAALGLLSKQDPIVGYERADGTIWRGTLHGVSVGDVRLEEVETWVEPRDVLTGRFRLAFRSDEPMLGGFLAMAGQEVSVSRVSASISFNRMQGSASPSAILEVEDVTARFRGKNCVDAIGEVRLKDDAFGLQVDGGLLCDNGLIVVDLLVGGDKAGRLLWTDNAKVVLETTDRGLADLGRLLRLPLRDTTQP
jgi:hypothetical protein